MYNVGGIDRKKIDIMVHDKTFTIAFVSVFARKSAMEFQQLVADLIHIQKIEDTEERKKKFNELDKDELERKEQLRNDIIENILVSNGYEYDADWWDKFTSYADQNEFIQFCMAKDVLSDKKKQAEA